MELPVLSVNGLPISSAMQPVLDSEMVEISCLPIPGARSARLRVGGEELGPPSIRFGNELWRWEWRPQGRVGVFTTRLDIESAEGRCYSREQKLVIAPGKLEQAQFEDLLAAIQETATSLLYMLGGGLIPVGLGRDPAGPHNLIEEYWTRLAGQASLATSLTRALAGSPRMSRRQHEEERGLDELSELSMASLARSAERPMDDACHVRASSDMRAFPLNRAGRTQLPRSLPVRIVEHQPVHYEHRLLAHVLDELVTRCRTIQVAIRQELARVELHADDGAAQTEAVLLQEWYARAGAAAAALRRSRGADFLAGIQPQRTWQGTSELMRRDRRYRQIGRLWQMLTERPFSIGEEALFDLPFADLPTLYEQWCLLEVARALEPVGELIDQQLIQSLPPESGNGSRQRWRLRLPEDQPLICRRRPDGALVTLYYRRRYRPYSGETARLGSLDPFLRIPDIAVEITASTRQPAVLVFDAKYRVAPAGGIPEEALADAYSYQAAIGFAGVRACLGTYLLFPGQAGFEANGVGAAPLVPGNVGSLARLVRRHLSSHVEP